jgi:hypothetical protein
MALAKALSIPAMEGNRKAKKDGRDAQNHPRRDGHGYAAHATEGIKTLPLLKNGNRPQIGTMPIPATAACRSG